MLTIPHLRALLRPRPADGHKGTFGHALIIAGQYGMAGAAILFARACLRSGAGKVSVHCPLRNNDILQTSLPEAILHHDVSDTHFSAPLSPAPYTAAAIGPGIGTHPATQQALLQQLALTADVPLVLDADALNILALNKDYLCTLHANTILTPHLAEYQRLAADEAPADFARRLGVILVLKGHPTHIYFPDGTHHTCPWGNSGMATAGSGDVLTGIICAFLAQGYATGDAALLGVSLHSIAGDKAAQALGEHSLIASDIITHLPLAFRALLSSSREAASEN